MNTSIDYNHKGFTLIETLFAVLIFSAALVSLMAIAGRGISAATSAREQVTAHYLAQEGLEIARNMRDRGGMNLLELCTSGDPCKVVYGSNLPELVPCGQSGCQTVKESNNAFVDVGNDSPYTRKVYTIPNFLDPNTNTYNEHRIISEVVWISKGISRRVVLQTILKQWQ